MSRKRRGDEARRAAADTETAHLTREVASRAVRRLDMLEWVILGVAALLSMGAGAMVALLLAHPLHLPFRTTWVVSSLLIFGVPGWISVRRAKREEKEWRERILTKSGGTDG